MIGIFRVSGITIDVVVAAIGVIGCIAVTYATRLGGALDDGNECVAGPDFGCRIGIRRFPWQLYPGIENSISRKKYVRGDRLEKL